MADTTTLASPRVDDGAPYVGSRFADVVDALAANPYQRVWGAAGAPGGGTSARPNALVVLV